MLFKILAHVIAGLIVVRVGFMLDGVSNDIAGYLIFAGLFWAVASPIYLPHARRSARRREAQAREELMECKKLLDAGLLKQEEFDFKSAQLKKIILKEPA